MKNKKFIILIIVLFFIGVTIHSINQLHGNTFEERQKILSKIGNGAIILSEIVIDNCIISEVIDQQGSYGYALFEANQYGDYSLKTKMLRTQEAEPIITDIVQIKDKFYEILMYNRSNLAYAEIVYTDDISGKRLEPFRVEMNNYRVAFVEAPEYASYTRDVSFYDNNGNMIE